VIKKRKVWEKEQKDLSGKRVVFLDESSVNAGMTRLYGRAIGKERVNDYVPDYRFERTSIISGISCDGVVAPMIFKGTLNAEVFKTYVAEFLAKELDNGDVLVLDNLSCHKVKGVVEPLIEKGVKILYLPPYSPDLNPIELMWSKVKSVLRRLKARAFESLIEGLKVAFNEISKKDIGGWFDKCGYQCDG
jgi:transposase